MIDDKDTMRRDRALLERELGELGVKMKGKACACPFHDDKHPSAGIYEKDGVWRFSCQVCKLTLDIFDLREKALGKPVGEQLKELKQESTPPEKQMRIFKTVQEMEDTVYNRSATYCYTNPDTKVVEMVVFRQELPDGGKKFLQARPAHGGFVFEAPPKPWPIYNRSRIKTADTVIVGEGEKVVHALAKVGIVATTSPGGAGKASYADWTPLAGKIIYLWPDNDLPDPKTGKVRGVEHMKEVAAILDKLTPACTLHWIDPADLGLPPKGDAVEYLEMYNNSADAVRCALTLAMPMGASGEVKTLIEDAISGKRKSIPWKYAALTRATKALLPGTVTCICGDPGDGKSLLLIENAAWWHGNGVPVALFELEEDRAYHLNRVLAQRANMCEITDPDWIGHKDQPDNAKAAREIFEQHKDFLDSFGRCLYAAPTTQPTLEELAKWVEERCAAGCRIIAIDPITSAASSSNKPWEDDLKFIMRVKTAAVQHGASIILVTHPRKGKRTGAPGLEDLAGGAAYSRFSQCVLWIIKHVDEKNVRCRSEFGPFNTIVNRTIGIKKSRNSFGGGMDIGFHFEVSSLCFAEQGIIVGDAEEHEEVPT